MSAIDIPALKNTLDDAIIVAEAEKTTRHFLRIVTALNIALFVSSLYYAINNMGNSCQASSGQMISYPLTTMVIILSSYLFVFVTYLTMLMVSAYDSRIQRSAGWAVPVFSAILLTIWIVSAISLFHDGLDCSSNGLGVVALLQFSLEPGIVVLWIIASCIYYFLA